jgi:hypothetical protein
MYGVAFKTPDLNLIAQMGDGGTPEMTNGMIYNTETNSWTSSKELLSTIKLARLTSTLLVVVASDQSGTGSCGSSGNDRLAKYNYTTGMVLWWAEYTKSTINRKL